MIDEEFGLYRWWLHHSRRAGRENDKDFIQDSFSSLQDSPAYQEDALRNGLPQPLIATRSQTNKCKITVAPGDEMNIGDLIYVFNEYWLCMEIYVDEYGMKYGEIWMCNELFHYQDHELNIINKYAIIDDGSYGKSSDKPIPVTSNYYTCYISLDKESEALYVDKRLAVDIIHDSKGNEILDVGKIVWIDTRSKNFGEGSHLLMFGLNDDVFNEEKDNLKLRICDYQEPDETHAEPEPPTTESKGSLMISGRDTVRIGTGRTYQVTSIDETGNSGGAPEGVIWSLEPQVDGVEISVEGDKCIVQVAVDDSLIGLTLHLSCSDPAGLYTSANKDMVVISIG